jgi:histidinol-phosphate aminotransferase
MPGSVEPHYACNAPRTHGGPADAELHALGIAAADLLDFSTSCNPYGPCAALAAAVREAPLERYPDPSAWLARRAIAATLDKPAAEIALGNGAAELLWTLARTLLRPGARALVIEPTFGEFRAAALCAGAAVHEWRAQAHDDFAIDLDAALHTARNCGAELIYLCTPNTPTGAALPGSDIDSAARAHPAMLFIVDQSFLSLSDRFADAQLALPKNVLCVRSLTKEQSIPGVRVGYVVGEAQLLARLEHQRSAWTTSAHAQAAAIAACDTATFVADSRRRLLHARVELGQRLRALRLPPVPSSAGFVLLKTGDAHSLRSRLLARHRILVRDCSSFGLPEHIRLAARPSADCDRLLTALRQELACPLAR